MVMMVAWICFYLVLFLSGDSVTGLSSAVKSVSSNGLRAEIKKDGSVIVVQGVVHGSEVSIGDVAAAIEYLEPDAIVLELCLSRWRSLKKRKTSTPRSVREEIDAILGGVRSASTRSGPLAGLTAGAVGTLFALARLGAGFEPGKEFSLPLKHAEENGIHIVLGDKDFFATVSSLTQGNTQFVQGLKALARGLTGDFISIPAAILYDSDRRLEFTKLSLLVALAVTPFTLITNALMTSLSSTLSFSQYQQTPNNYGTPFIFDSFFAFFSILLLASLGDAFLTRRDIVLADSVRDALQLPAPQKRLGLDHHTTSSPRVKKVLVVVGALHVNGILTYLTAGDDTPGPSSSSSSAVTTSSSFTRPSR